MFHGLAENLGNHGQSAPALLQGAAEGFEQIDDSRQHRKGPLFLRVFLRGVVEWFDTPV